MKSLLFILRMKPIERILDFLSNLSAQSYAFRLNSNYTQRSCKAFPSVIFARYLGLQLPFIPSQRHLNWGYSTLFSQTASDENLIQLRRIMSRKAIYPRRSEMTLIFFDFFCFILVPATLVGLFQPLLSLHLLINADFLFSSSPQPSIYHLGE